MKRIKAENSYNNSNNSNNVQENTFHIPFNSKLDATLIYKLIKKEKIALGKVNKQLILSIIKKKGVSELLKTKKDSTSSDSRDSILISQNYHNYCISSPNNFNNSPNFSSKNNISENVKLNILNTITDNSVEDPIENNQDEINNLGEKIGKNQNFEIFDKFENFSQENFTKENQMPFDDFSIDVDMIDFKQLDCMGSIFDYANNGYEFCSDKYL